MFKYLLYVAVNLLDSWVSIGMAIAWLAGFVLAKGFWSTLACIIPFYSWYLVLEKVMAYYKLI